MSRWFLWLALGLIGPSLHLACGDDDGRSDNACISGTNTATSGATGCDTGTSGTLWTGATTSGSDTGLGTMSASTGATGLDTTSTTSSGSDDSSASQSGSDTGTSAACTLFPATEVPGCPAILGTQYCAEKGVHIPAETPAVWTTNPPHSGMHEGTWADWGIHEDFVPARKWVHNLEHSGVVLVYLCPGGCPAEEAILQEVVNQRPKLRVLATAYPEVQGSRFAAISWGWIHRMETPDLATLLCFVDQHEGHAPENIPKGASPSLGSCNLD